VAGWYIKYQLRGRSSNSDDAAVALDAGVTALRRERDSRLRIAASMTVAEYLLRPWLAGPARDLFPIAARGR
jgi:hypothetical protein